MAGYVDARGSKFGRTGVKGDYLGYEVIRGKKKGRGFRE
jgi:hypothetical protein